MSYPYWIDQNFLSPIAKNIAPLHKVDITYPDTPLLILDITKSENAFHAASPPGFLSAQNHDQFTNLITHLQKTHKDEKIASAFIQYRGPDTDPIEKSIAETFAQSHYRIEKRKRVNVTLNDDLEHILSHCRRDTRARIKQTQKAGFYFKPDYHSRFFELYDSIAKQNKFSQAYCYARPDIENMLTVNEVKAVSVFDGSGQYAGGSIIGMVNNHEYDYILSAYNAGIENSGRAVLWHSIIAAKDLGGRYLNLGGGIRDGDGLHDFKLSFGGINQGFLTIKIILDEELFRSAYTVNDKVISLEGRFP